MDARIHFRGRMDLKGISKIDKEIQKILNMYSSWEEAVEQNVWMVIGDNGHSPTGTRYKEFIIDLRKILKNYRIARIERQVKNKDQLVLCVNQRMTYIYVLDKNLSLKTIVDDLKTDTRIDIIAWKEEDAVHVTSGLREGSLRFRPNGQYMDVYNQTWELDGEGKLLDLDVTDDNKVSFGDYPDALARLHSALHSHEGRFIIVNAKPGCDFKAQLTPFHLSGAAHGSLHKQESFVPLIITGSDEKPTYPRFVDMKEFILRLVVD